MIKVVIYFLLTIIFFISAIFITPVSLIVPLTKFSEELSFSTSKGNLFSGEINDLKVSNLKIDQLIYDNSFSTERINSNISFTGLINGSSKISYVYGSDYLLIENIRALLKFNDDLIGNIKLSFNNTSQITLKNQECINGNGEGQFSSNIIEKEAVVFIECVKGFIEIYSINNDLKEKVGTIKINNRNLTLEILPRALIDGLPFYLNKKIKLNLIR